MSKHYMMKDSPSTSEHTGAVGKIVYVFERLMPDPFVLSIMLTVLVIALAFVFVPHLSVNTVVESWYGGIFKILQFAFQMVLILLTGYAVADAPLVRSGLRGLASHARTPAKAILVMFPVVAFAGWLNWGLGLVVAAFLSREIAHQTKVDFGWLVAGAYSAWSVCNNGLSSSIALSQASHGSEMNFVEQATGKLIPLNETIFSPVVLVPSILVVVVMAVIFIAIHPKGANIKPFIASDSTSASHDQHKGQAGSTPAYRMERSVIGTVIVAALGIAAIVFKVANHGISLDINLTILIFFLVGLILQGRPINYANAIRSGVSETGSMILQYPMYGGIMGIMSGTGLAAAIAHGFVIIASSTTLPIFSYISSMIITLLVPSAGGHWAVQGPFVVPAAASLGASMAHSTMAVAMAENVSNMLQPFWAVPVVAMAGIKIQRVMGYTSITFLVSFVIYGICLLIL